MKTLYRGRKYDIREVTYSGTVYNGVVRSDGKGIDKLFFDLEKAKERWKQLESEAQDK